MSKIKPKRPNSAQHLIKMAHLIVHLTSPLVSSARVFLGRPLMLARYPAARSLQALSLLGHDTRDKNLLCYHGWKRSVFLFHTRPSSCKSHNNLLPFALKTRNCQNCFCQNFVKFPPILIILGRKMTKRLKLCEYTYFPLNCFALSHYSVKRRRSKLLGYTTLKVVICNKLSNDLISTQSTKMWWFI